MVELLSERLSGRPRGLLAHRFRDRILILAEARLTRASQVSLCFPFKKLEREDCSYRRQFECVA
jgi:hypothetical protein